MNEGSNMPCLSCGSCADGGGRCRCGGEDDEFGGCKRRNLKNPQAAYKEHCQVTLELKTDYAENGHGTWHA